MFRVVCIVVGIILLGAGAGLVGVSIAMARTHQPAQVIRAQRDWACGLIVGGLLLLGLVFMFSTIHYPIQLPFVNER